MEGSDQGDGEGGMDIGPQYPTLPPYELYPRTVWKHGEGVGGGGGRGSGGMVGGDDRLVGVPSISQFVNFTKSQNVLIKF